MSASLTIAIRMVDQQMLLYGLPSDDFLNVVAGLRLHSLAETVVVISAPSAPAGRAQSLALWNTASVGVLRF